MPKVGKNMPNKQTIALLPESYKILLGSVIANWATMKEEPHILWQPWIFLNNWAIQLRLVEC